MKTLQNFKGIFALICVFSISSCEKETPNPGSTENYTSPYKKPSGNSGSTEFSGQGTALKAVVLGIQTTFSETDPLSSSGGANEASLLDASIPDVLTARVLHAATIGQGDRSRSEASVASLELNAGANRITAGLLMSRAMANCGPLLTGSSVIVGLAINGQAVTVSGNPNQTILIPGGKVIINEQSTFKKGSYGAITVTALHVIVDGVADVIISRSHADIKCQGQAACTGGDFMTGGGFISGTPSGAKGNFGVAGGIKNANSWGHLTYIDHGTGMKVKASSISAYTVIDATTRKIDGTCEINGAGGFTFSVSISDNGEPGTGDKFDLTLSNGYHALGYLNGGNIQLHKPCF
jgi:hypothetical protein